MPKQLHVNLEDAVFEALSSYSAKTGASIKDSVSQALTEFISRQNTAHSNNGQSFTFIDLFAGIGGMRIAYESAGGRCVYSNEWNKYSQQTYFANFGDQPDGDITKVDRS